MTKNKDKKENSMDKVKVLCLHGYRQNADSFKSKIGSFRKIVKKYADFEFVSASHIAPSLDNSQGDNEDNGDTDKSTQKSWWFNKEDGTFKGTNKSGPAFGFSESLELVEKVWKEGDFQGLLGFSQGACFAALICSLSAQGLTSIKPRFVILSSGFKSGSLAHMNYYENKLTLPSLHIRGESDEIITPDMSIDLESCFDESTRQVIVHPGGHYFASTVQQKQDYINFFQDRLQEYLEEKELERASKENTLVVESDSNDVSE